jgi:hypothetical protein
MWLHRQADIKMLQLWRLNTGDMLHRDVSVE